MLRIHSPWAPLPEDLLARLAERVALSGSEVEVVHEGEKLIISRYPDGEWAITSHNLPGKDGYLGCGYVGSYMSATKVKRLIEGWLKGHAPICGQLALFA